MRRSTGRRILSGLRTFIQPPPKGTGGTNSARYYYSVYLRHLVTAVAHGLSIEFREVAEIGPGSR